MERKISAYPKEYRKKLFSLSLSSYGFGTPQSTSLLSNHYFHPCHEASSLWDSCNFTTLSALFFFILRFLNFSIIVDLQCPVNFYCTAKVTQLSVCVCVYIYTHIFFLILSSIMFYYKGLDIIPCAIEKDLIAYPLLPLSCYYKQMKWMPVSPWPQSSSR